MPVLLILAGLCAWEGSQWLLPALALDPLPFALVSSAAFGGLALFLGRWGGRGAGVWLGLWGALALGMPAMLLVVAQRYFAAEVGAAALAGVPVVIVVVASMGEEGMGEALLPAIVGLGGALLLIPVRLPESGNGWFGLALDLLAVLLAGSFSVVAHRAAQAVPAMAAVRCFAGGNAVVLAVWAGLLWVSHGARLQTYAVPTAPVIAAVLGVGVATALAATVLLRALQPLAFASRFLVVPLVGAVEGYVLLRPTLSFRALAGAALMAVAAFLLLRAAPAAAGSVVPARSRD